MSSENSRMAIIQFGALVAGIRGTLGGVTYSGNGAGAYIKSWARPTNPRTQAQESVRAQASAIGAWWRSLSQSQRDDWNTWAANGAQVQYNVFGEPYFLSGAQFGGRVNRWRQSAGLAFRNDEPTDSWPVAPTLSALAAQIDTGVFSLVLTYPSAEWAAGEYLIAFATRTFGRGAARPGRGWRLIAAIESPGDTSQHLTDEFTDIFGEPAAGDRVHLRLAIQTAQGLRGPTSEIYADVEEV